MHSTCFYWNVLCCMYGTGRVVQEIMSKKTSREEKERQSKERGGTKANRSEHIRKKSLARAADAAVTDNIVVIICGCH